MDGDEAVAGRADHALEGRDQDVAAVRAAIKDLGDTPDGGGGLVVVRGGAGIGKSAVLAHAVAALRDGGSFVLDLRPDELDRRIPYAAFAGGLDHHEAPAPDVRMLLADLRHALSRPEEASLAAVRGAAQVLFATVRDQTPVVLAIDDLPLLDDDTVVLVADLMRRVERHPLVVVATVRSPGDPPSDVLAALLARAERVAHARTIELGPLAPDAVRRLVERRLGRPVTTRLVDHVLAQSGGNPFLVIHTLLDLDESGGIALGGEQADVAGGDRGARSLSTGRRATVLSRLVRVGDEARRVGRAVALLGVVTPSRVDLCAGLAELSVGDAQRAFDLLVEREILVTDAGTYRFSHELVRDAMYQEIGPAERWSWHRLVAQRLRALPPTSELSHEIARHVRESAEPGDDEAVAILYAEAERACSAAPHSAVPWYESACAVAGSSHPLTGEITARLARAQFLAGRPKEAADAGRRALGALPDGPQRDRVVMLVLEALAKTSSIDDAIELLDAERAQSRTPRLAARAAHILGVAGRTEESHAAADLAISELDAMTAYDRLAAIIDLVQMCCLNWFAGLRPLVGELHAAAQDAPPALRFNAYTTMSYALAMQGETREASDAIQRAQEHVADPEWNLYRAELAVARAVNLFNVGDWDSTLSLVAAVRGDLEEAGSLAFLNVLRGIESMLLAHRGEWAAARDLTRHAPRANHPIYGALHSGAQVELCLLTNDHDRARALVVPLLEDPRVHGTLRRTLLCQLAEVEAEAGDDDAALRHVEVLRSVAPDDLDHSTRIRVELVRGRATGVADVVAEAVASADRHQLALLRGRGRLLLGSMDVDPERSLHDAMRIFHSLGAAPWRRRTAAELRRRGLPIPRHRPAPSTFLTEMEAQIARLIQLGRSNREVAATVCLSVKTVEGYLSRIYAKTGCSSRLELARVLDEGLLG